MKELKGLIPAVITPLKEDGSIDKGLFEKQVAYLSDAGVDGFFISCSGRRLLRRSFP
ncbi:MAG: dihydrodipicolinate synthase family protein [Spirochaetales bacterium]|nr:dihydrodipicolinate synthase family protein [Spirochaetales bacterium]